MTILTAEEIIEAHSSLIQKTGGLHGIRDRALVLGISWVCTVTR